MMTEEVREGEGAASIAGLVSLGSTVTNTHTRSRGRRVRPNAAQCSPVELYAHLVVLLLSSSPTLLPSYSQGLPAVWKRHKEMASTLHKGLEDVSGH